MQQENAKNPFNYPTNLKRVEFCVSSDKFPYLEIEIEEFSVSIFVSTSDDNIYSIAIYYDSDLEDEILRVINRYDTFNLQFFEESNEDWVSIVQKEAIPVIAGKFFISTSVYKDKCPEGKKLIEINAGKSFGTGEHPTTKTCIEALCNLTGDFSNILDIGSGSGVLSIAAKKLWEQSVVQAIEIEEQAIEHSKENFKLNNVDIKVDIKYQVDTSLKKYDLIIANILLPVLLELYSDILKMLNDGGVLIFSGITENQKTQLLETYNTEIFYLTEEYNSEGWVVMQLKKK
jgi:ribosomal protein L11 methyltransferase